MSTELAIIENLELVPFFTKGDSVDEILAKIKKEAMVHVPDVSTLKGRNAIKANVTKVKKSKTYLESHGKDLAAEYKAIPKVIDANRKKSRDFLNALEEEIRAPLTAWEVIDKAEKAQVIDTKSFLIEYELQHEDGLQENELKDLRAAQAEADRQAEIKAAAEQAAADAKAQAEQEAADRIAKAEREKTEAQQREAKEKQDRLDAQARAEQAEQDNITAEQARKEEIRIDYHKRMVQHIVDCGNGFIGGSPQSFGILFYELENKIIIDDSFEEFRQEAEKARSDSLQKLKDCQENQAKDHAEAEAKAKHDIEAAAENARQAQIQRQRQEDERLRSEAAQREANKRHCGAINRTAMQALMTHAGLDEQQAKLAIKAIAKGLIPAVTISY